MDEDPETHCATMRADVYQDGVITITDLAFLAAQFLQSIPPATARFDQDGDNLITIADLARAAGEFLKNVAACPD
jgi:hypothetical protein